MFLFSNYHIGVFCPNIQLSSDRHWPISLFDKSNKGFIKDDYAMRYNRHPVNTHSSSLHIKGIGREMHKNNDGGKSTGEVLLVHRNSQIINLANGDHIVSMLRSLPKTAVATNRAERRVGERKSRRKIELQKDRQKPFMSKTARSHGGKLRDDTSHSTTKGENIGWVPFTEKLMRSYLEELSL